MVIVNLTAKELVEAEHQVLGKLAGEVIRVKKQERVEQFE
jgi:hypothetical protein